ncbi:hypothetical protein J31TS4_12380 [Paenibacillus sp. J31TS4]|uniref:class I SAM-dependent methyltransferase n=1 Tax=Paenibacillus sp. J31TS4 TaxID=2807195 RepID=UPI001B067224|nr:class I SAM-dependent methyltransferase [Paenibacillus sp. J31TS4]GIP37958.1 hypothetical protein J31TS4_12380 [Paenibacillus sp. J31TS4]
MDAIVRYYSSFDEWGRLDREPLEFRVNWHMIRKHLPPEGRVLDNGAGPGKYAIELARLGYRVTLSDLTPRLVRQAEEKAAELGLSDRFEAFLTLDARQLAGLDDGMFDAALMLGPFYHLQTEEDRSAAAAELNRVVKPGGVVFAAFMPRSRFTLTSIQTPRHWKPHDTMDAIEAFRASGRFDHADEGRFTGAYYFQVGDVVPFMEAHGFETLGLIGSSAGTAGQMSPEQWQYWRERGEEEWNRLHAMLYEMAADPALLGLSSHLLYIGRKRT